MLLVVFKVLELIFWYKSNLNDYKIQVCFSFLQLTGTCILFLLEI